jgi:hypothetical protein
MREQEPDLCINIKYVYNNLILTKSNNNNNPSEDLIAHIYTIETRSLRSKLYGSHKQFVSNYICADVKSDLNLSWAYRLSFIFHILEKFMTKCMNFSDTISFLLRALL